MGDSDMARKKDPNVALRKLQDQITKLKKELQTYRKETEQLQKEYVKDVEAAVEAGYEMGFIEAEEKQLHREKAILAAVEDFEKTYAKGKTTKTAQAATKKTRKKATRRKTAPKKSKTSVKERRRRIAKKETEQTQTPAPAPQGEDIETNEVEPVLEAV